MAQLIGWGISYYLIGVFGEAMAADLGHGMSVVHGGFSLALMVMGVASGPAGRLIDRFGGRPMLVAGAVLTAVGCAGLALAHGLVLHYAAWACLGLAMRLSLYDAAFAALARLLGPAARKPIAQITLLGGLASTVFWPIGHGLAEAFGWRGAVWSYAGFALATIPMHLALPAGRWQPASPAESQTAGNGGRHSPLAALLFVATVTLAGFLNSGMSAHMITVMTGLGLAAATAIWIASLRGIGQSLARLGEVLSAGRFDPFDLNLAATLMLPVCFVAALLSGQWLAAAITFNFLYGAGNGILTITRGTLPLLLFDPRNYGTTVGRLLVPSFFLSAVAPLAYALVIEHFGVAAVLWLSLALGLGILAAAVVLRLRFAQKPRSPG
jgi:predicted MFS family arabinose efflux permease